MEENKSKDADFDFEINEDNEKKDENEVNEKVEVEDSSAEKKKKEDIIFESSGDTQSDIHETLEVDEALDNDDNLDEDLDEDFEIIESDEEFSEEINSYRKRKRLKLVIIAILVLIVCSAGCYFFIQQRALLDKFDASLHDNQYTLAKNIYREFMDSQKSEADSMVAAKVEEIYSRYYKGAIDLKKAESELDSVSKIKSGAREEISNMRALFAVIVSSQENFEKGKEAYEAGELKKSIIYFGKVIQKDAKYKEAQNRLKKISAEYRKEQIAKAEEFANDEDYNSAIKIMYDYLKLIANDKIAQKQLQTYKSAKLDLYISDIEDTVDIYTKKNDYVGAIKIVKNAITEYGEDKRLTTLFTSLKKDMYKEVDSFIESGRYTTAVSILKNYLKVVNDDSKATELIKKYSNKVSSGVYLSKVKPKSQEGKSYVITELQDYKDANGEKYEDVLEVVGYRNLESSGNRVIENNGYTKLTGTVGYVSSKDIKYYKEGEGRVIIYGDGKKLFTSDIMTEKTKNQKVDLNIKGYKSIKFAWEPINAKNVKMYSIVLGDFKFTK